MKDALYKPRETYKLALPGQYENSDVKELVLRPYRGRDIYHATLHSGETVRLERFSTIANMFEKTALVQWSANKASAAAYVGILPDTAYPESYLLQLLDSARFAWMRERDEAGVWGTQVHKIIEDFLNYGLWPAIWDDIPLPVQNSLRAFAEWWPTAGLEVLQVEKYVYSMKWAFGGRTDLLVRCKKTGLIGILDWKTSKQVSEGFFVQLYAYSGALIELGIDIQFALSVRLGRKEKKAQVERVDRAEIEEGWQKWKLMCLLHPWRKKLKARARKANREFEKEIIEGEKAEREADFQKWLDEFPKEEGAWLEALTNLE